jgi:hypothetical protein
MHCCGSCAAECEPLELSERIPLQSEVVGPSRLEAA